MSKIIPLISILLSFPLVSSEVGKERALYDFDHGIHYRLTQLGNKYYKLSVSEGKYEEFSKQAVFLLRKSKDICGSEHFNLALESGIQSFKKFPSEPRAYQGPLVVRLTCKIND